jgi:hypothetical protein
MSDLATCGGIPIVPGDATELAAALDGRAHAGPGPAIPPEREPGPVADALLQML